MPWTVISAPMPTSARRKSGSTFMKAAIIRPDEPIPTRPMTTAAAHMGAPVKQ